MSNLSDKVVVLTGACGTIGRYLSAELLKRDNKVIAVDTNQAALESLKSELSGGVKICRSDVSDPDSCKALADEVKREFGEADVLINNHQCKPEGFLYTDAEDFPFELWKQIVDVNLTGTFLMCKEIGRLMLEAEKGAIINVASTYGVVSSNPSLYENNTFGNPVAYSASKGGVVMLSKYLAANWASKGVRVNCISPHGILNKVDKEFEARFKKMSPLGRVMDVSEILGGILFLASDDSSYMTGSNLILDGGWTAW